MKTYKYKLKLSKEQESVFEEWINVCRYMYNIALEERITSYQMRKKPVSRFDQYNQLPQIKKEFPFVSKVYSDTLGDVMDRVDKSYQNFFRGAGFPGFAKKGFYNSFTFKRNYEIFEKYIKLPKIGKVGYFNSRPFEGTPKTATIKKEIDGYYICIVSEQDIPEPTIDNSHAIGLDVGITHFCTLSNGKTFDTSLFLQSQLQKLRILNRKLSRQKMGSNSSNKTKLKIQKLYKKISETRKDFLHKTSAKIADEYSACYIEDLKLQKMKTVSSDLTRKMSDSGFGMFREFLQYKLKERGKHLGFVNPAYTSQTCNACGMVDKKSRLSQSEFVCTSCGNIDNADLNASKNILSRGTA